VHMAAVARVVVVDGDGKPRIGHERQAWR
jgi:hypothetical protein